MNLLEIRKAIDRLDYKIVKMFDQRMELTLRATRLKPKIQDKKREKEKLDIVSRIPGRFIGKDFVKHLFTDIMAESRRLQALKPELVGFPGEHGAFTETAILSYNPEMAPIPCMSITEVLSGVARGDFCYCMVPLENSFEGTIPGIENLLIEKPLYIVGELKLQIIHTLLTLPDTNLNEVRLVYSHPQALDHCREFIEENNMEALPFYDTAGAAKMLAETMPGSSAVIANKICSRIYGLKIIKDNIGKKSLNHTRFVLLSKERNKEEGNKCSIAFISDGKDGELFNVLKLFSDAGISLIQVVSRPSTKKMGKTITLIDLKGSINDKNIAGTLAVLEKKSIIYKLLGCYKEASPIGDQDLQPVI